MPNLEMHCIDSIVMIYYAYHYNFMLCILSQPDGAVVSTTSSTIASDSTVVDSHDPTYMEATWSDYLPTHQEPTVSSASNSNLSNTISTLSWLLGIFTVAFDILKRKCMTKLRIIMYDVVSLIRNCMLLLCIFNKLITNYAPGEQCTDDVFFCGHVISDFYQRFLISNCDF